MSNLLFISYFIIFVIPGIILCVYLWKKKKKNIVLSILFFSAMVILLLLSSILPLTILAFLTYFTLFIIPMIFFSIYFWRKNKRFDALSTFGFMAISTFFVFSLISTHLVSFFKVLEVTINQENWNNIPLIFLASILLGYFFGCIQTAHLIGKFKFNVNVKESGSKNAGASNAVLLFGWKAGIFVSIIDILKACLPVIIIFYLVNSISYFHYDMIGGDYITLLSSTNSKSILIQPNYINIYGIGNFENIKFNFAVLCSSLAGLGAMLGHIYPFFMKFNGGKGMSCYIGVILALDFRLGLLFILCTGLLVMITNYVAIGTILGVIILPIFLNFYWFDSHSLGSLYMYVVNFASLLIIFKHSENLVKISKGTEKTFWSAFNKNK